MQTPKYVSANMEVNKRLCVQHPKITDLLLKVNPESKFEKIVHVEGDENFTVTLRLKSSHLNGDDADEKCEDYRRKFERESNTGLIADTINATMKRFLLNLIYIDKNIFISYYRLLYNKKYWCQHSSKNKCKTEKAEAKLRGRNFECRATVAIKFKKTTENTVRTDSWLAKGFNVEIMVIV